MRKTTINLFIIISTIGFLFTSCEKINVEDYETNKSGNTINIITRSASDIEYPVTLIAFNENGKAVESTVIESNNTNNTTLTLDAGKYHIIAISGIEDCKCSGFSSLEEIITLPEANYTKTSIQMGCTDIMINQNATATITLYNQVAAIDISLTDIPDDVQSVNVSLSSLNNKINFSGQCSGSISTTIDLKRQEDGTWSSQRLYTLPSDSEKTTISITTISANGQETYGYTYNGGIKANTPYSFNGSFNKGFNINSTLTVAGWNDPEEISFTFGDNENSDEGNGSDDSDIVFDIPDAGTIWNNHFVGAVEYLSEVSADIILISLTEWSGISSAYNSEIPNMANDIAESYTEDGLKDWMIPTKDDIKIIRNSIGLEYLADTNNTLQENSYTPLKYGEDIENDATIRYLCEDAKYSYAWDTATTTKAGSRRSYHLRLVKRINIDVVLLP